MSRVKQGTTPYWVFYQSEDHKKIDNCGKWMHFFSKSNYQLAQDVCIRAIKDDIVTTCKYQLENWVYLLKLITLLKEQE